MIQRGLNQNAKYWQYEPSQSLTIKVGGDLAENQVYEGFIDREGKVTS